MGGFRCTRAFLVMINVFYLMISVVLISVAGYSRLTSIVGSLTIVGGIIACGVFLMIISVIGIIGAVHHHQILLFFYMIIIFLIFLIQFSVAVACLAVTTEQQEKLLRELWDKAGNDNREEAQMKLDCCGFNNETEINAGRSFPQCSTSTCCANKNDLCCIHGDIINNATTTTPPTKCPCSMCFARIVEKTDKGFKMTGGVGLFFAFLEVFGVWFAVRFRNMKNPSLIPENFL